MALAAGYSRVSEIAREIISNFAERGMRVHLQRGRGNGDMAHRWTNDSSMGKERVFSFGVLGIIYAAVVWTKGFEHTREAPAHPFIKIKYVDDPVRKIPMSRIG